MKEELKDKLKACPAIDKDKPVGQKEDGWLSYYPPPHKKIPGNRRGNHSKILLRIFVAIIIFAVLLFFKETHNPIGSQVRENLRYILAADWNYQPVLEKVVQLGLQAANLDLPFFSNLQATKIATSGSYQSNGMLTPLSGQVIKPFGWVEDPLDGMERFHPGIDIAASAGTPVKAVLNGRVDKIGEDAALGEYLLLAHNQEGLFTLYGQLDGVNVTVGQLVYAGDVIAYAGSKGEVGKEGIHFEVREKRKLVDPLTRIQFTKSW